MRKIVALLVPVLFASCVLMMAEHILTNSDITDLTKAQIPDSLIVDEIHRSKCDFSTTPQDLIQLRKAGVSDAVLGEMIKAGKSAPTANPPQSATVTATAATTTADPASIPLPTREVGVYYLKDSAWVTVPPEIVNWRTGGVLKSLGTAGIIKGDINGDVRGPTSHTSVDEPVEFLFVVPEGSYITEYQLLHLHEHDDRRAFRTVTGGVFHASGGATRDVLPFQSEKVGARTFKVTIDHLQSGEYGFLPPGNNASRQAMSSLGAMYTFHVVE